MPALHEGHFRNTAGKNLKNDGFAIKKLLPIALLARDLETSRGAVDRILDSENTSMTLKSLGAIADLFGKRLEINFVDA